MSETINPAAPHFIPSFITAPGQTDYLLYGVAGFLVVLILFAGSMYFWLHSIPERISHGSSKIQFQLVAVLSLLALFTHNNAFWVAALLLALVPIPDFWTPLAEMAESLAKMAGRRLGIARADGAHEAGHEEAAADALAQLAALTAASSQAAVATAHDADRDLLAPPADDAEPAVASPGAPAAKAGKPRVLSSEGAAS